VGYVLPPASRACRLFRPWPTAHVAGCLRRSRGLSRTLPSWPGPLWRTVRSSQGFRDCGASQSAARQCNERHEKRA